MDERLLEEVTNRLDTDPNLDPEIRQLIDAALLDELDIVVDDGTMSRISSPPSAPEPLPQKSVYVGAVKVAGFRGVGPKANLELTPGPGLTLVIGRNGSGKSSFAEGVELLLTGDNQRWSQRKTKEWQSGFRNAHAPESVSLETELFVDGERKTVARRSWKKGETLDGGTFTLTAQGKTYNSVADMGWTEPLQSFRPFLSYNEIGSILDQGPSKLFDTLDPILGLADLGEAAARLKARQKEMKTLEKEVKDCLRDLRSALEGLGDERAKAASQALAGRRWQLKDLAALVTQDALADESSVSARLATLAQLPGPNLQEVATLADEFKEARKRQRTIQDADSERARRLMALLERALAFHEHAGDGDCPICGQAAALDAPWARRTTVEMQTLRKDAASSAAIHEAVEKGLAQIRKLFSEPPAIFSDARGLGLDMKSAQEAWADWATLRTAAPEVLAERLEGQALELAAAVEKLRSLAEEKRQGMEREWREMALKIHSWLPNAFKVQQSAKRFKQLKAAEQRLLREAKAIRDARFAPISEQVLRFWTQLRARSSVDIAGLALSGTGTRRKVEIGVAVDGAEAAALGVMSQGELHALALSLFLPRATMRESPFGFLFIDDPVQAMDMARIDGLAHVLEEVAQTHQVVVFTHDDRLPEAVRRLEIAARVLAVERRKDSVVTVQLIRDPVQQLLSDAFALVKTKDLSNDVMARVVPGMCRQAVEAACIEVVRRRRLAAGVYHREVEELLVANKTLNQLLALAMKDDPNRTNEAKESLKRRIDPRAPQIVDRCNRGAHHGWDGDPMSFVRDIEMVTKKLRGIS